MARRQRDTNLPPPFLKRIWLPDDPERDMQSYPMSLPLVKNGGFDFRFEKSITILVGENGSGKSTILEAIAASVGFGELGGAAGMNATSRSTSSGADADALGEALLASWLPQVKRGWFFRADTFEGVAGYLDEMGSPTADYLSASHGEGFMTFFEERLDRQGFYIFDEPEAALSPQKQFDFLKLLRKMQRSDNCQVIMATHSPILMAMPGADLWSVHPYGIAPVRLEETSHFRIYREFIQYPHETVEAMIE